MTTLRSIESFLRRTGMAATSFGRESVRDPRLVHDLRKGRELSERMKRRIEHFMNIYTGGAAQ
jgi:2,4-dienoyl-CoA reductase-like NADH-dependent reductase (Old Yellow Enzyme family)